jgi:hypothetical protein
MSCCMKAFITSKQSQTIFDALNKKVMYFGYQDFMEKLVKGDHCFMCGASPAEKPFNNEHIIPDWVLRKFNLHNKDRITLPNETTMKYGQFVLPCCAECNSLLGQKVEVPISEYFSLPYPELSGRLDADPAIFGQLFIWMCLIYSKTQLKYSKLALHRDKPVDKRKIGDLIGWSEMHHVHCMARVPYTGAKVGKQVYGSVILLPALPDELGEDFDYLDSTTDQCAMIRIGGIAVFAVMNDSRACQMFLTSHLSKIDGPLTPMQLKEIFAHLVFLNSHLKERPAYQFTILPDGCEISAKLAEKRELTDGSGHAFTAGELLHKYADHYLPHDLPNRPALLQEIKEEKRQYLFNERGEFANYANPRKPANE